VARSFVFFSAFPFFAGTLFCCITGLFFCLFAREQVETIGAGAKHGENAWDTDSDSRPMEQNAGGKHGVACVVGNHVRITVLFFTSFLRDTRKNRKSKGREKFHMASRLEGGPRDQDFEAAMGRGGIVFLLSPKHTRQGEEVIARVDGPCLAQGVCAWGKKREQRRRKRNNGEKVGFGEKKKTQVASNN
jgi:hypothetical protein